jgi:hypothetical protein
MEKSLTIETSGKQLDGCYFMGLTMFWIFWTPLTLIQKSVDLQNQPMAGDGDEDLG